MGANGKSRQEKCGRGHLLVEPNVRASNNGGRKCIACERTHTAAHNWKKRQGVVFTEEDFQEISDKKFARVMAGLQDYGNPLA